MIKVLVDLLVFILNNGSDELGRITPMHQMVFLPVLADDLTTNFTLGGVPVALHRMGSQLLENHFSGAIGALNNIITVLISSLLLNLTTFSTFIIIIITR